MELEQLRIFLTAASEGSFSAAARKLYISHSTVSRAVSALESELCCRLFVRSENSVCGLTEKGERLRAKAEQLLALADGIIEDMK